MNNEELKKLIDHMAGTMLTNISRDDLKTSDTDKSYHEGYHNGLLNIWQELETMVSPEMARYMNTLVD